MPRAGALSWVAGAAVAAGVAAGVAVGDGMGVDSAASFGTAVAPGRLVAWGAASPAAVPDAGAAVAAGVCAGAGVPVAWGDDAVSPAPFPSPDGGVAAGGVPPPEEIWSEMTCTGTSAASACRSPCPSEAWTSEKAMAVSAGERLALAFSLKRNTSPPSLSPARLMTSRRPVSGL